MSARAEEIAAALRETVARAAPWLRALPADQAAQPRAPGKWSVQQMVGHLIDSASNNHQRFVRAAQQEPLVFPGYEQDAWVALQRYDDAPWLELVALWEAFNRQLARVVEALPADAVERVRPQHNLDEIAWESPLPGEPVTLAFFMQDYVHHLRHHLRWIDPDLADAPVQQLGHGRWKSS